MENLFSEVEKIDSLFVVHNNIEAKMTVAEMFDAKIFSYLKAVSYVSSPKFFAETVKNFSMTCRKKLKIQWRKIKYRCAMVKAE